MSDAVTAILDSAGRFPVLRHDRQLELAYRVRKWLDWDPADGPCPVSIEAKGRRAKKRLLETNLRLVIAQAARYRHVWQQHPNVLPDLIQEGTLGLNRAIEKYDPTRGYALSTYAVSWIRQAIGRSVPYLTDIIRRPGGVLDNQRKLTRLITDYQAQHGVRPSIEWLSEQSGLTASQIHTAVVIGSVRVVSIDQPARDQDNSEGSSLGDLIPCQSAVSPEEAMVQEHRIELAHNLVDELPEIEQDLIRSIFFEGAGYAECGARLGVSRTRVGQLKLRALDRMRGDYKPPKDTSRQVRDCTVCGTAFIPTTPGRQVCSAQCRSERRRRTNRAWAQRKKLELTTAA